MAFDEDKIEALEDAIAKGVSEFQYKDRTLKYRSVEQMERILAKMKAEVRDEPITRRKNATYDSGL